MEHLIIAVVITTVTNSSYIICFSSSYCKNTKKNLCLRRWLSTRFTSSIPAAPETRMMNAEWFTKDHAHSVFMWTAHLDYGVANVQFDPVLSMRQQVQGG